MTRLRPAQLRPRSMYIRAFLKHRVMEYGPQLSTQLLTAREKSVEDGRDQQDHVGEEKGPVMGPKLRQCTDATSSPKPDSSGESSALSSKDKEEQEDVYGPELPPGFSEAQEEPATDKGRKRVVGPSLPPSGVCLQSTNPFLADQEDAITVGPVLPSESVETSGVSVAAAAFEARARAMKNKLEGKPSDSVNVKQRETWMIELPPERNTNKIDLGPRKFRKQEFDLGDRSVWTDTPADRLKKAQTSEETSSSTSRKKKKGGDGPGLEHEDDIKESELRKHIEEYNKGCRGESLLNMHRQKQKEDVGQGSKSVRRPFNRETDLELPKRDSAKRRKVLEKSSNLSSRFSQSSFL